MTPMTDPRRARAAAFDARHCPDCGRALTMAAAITDLWTCAACDERWYIVPAEGLQ
jgi:ribosomal protein L37AE/L43A